jgi:hypothetical protein
MNDVDYYYTVLQIGGWTQSCAIYIYSRYIQRSENRMIQFNTNLSESSKEGCGSKRTVLPITTTTTTTAAAAAAATTTTTTTTTTTQWETGKSLLSCRPSCIVCEVTPAVDTTLLNAQLTISHISVNWNVTSVEYVGCPNRLRGHCNRNVCSFPVFKNGPLEQSCSLLPALCPCRSPSG